MVELRPKHVVGVTATLLLLFGCGDNRESNGGGGDEDLPFVLPDTGGGGTDLYTPPVDTGPDIADVPAPEDVIAADDGPPVIDEGPPPPDIPLQPGSVEGVVWDASGAPFEGAVVAVIGYLGVATNTDAQGFFLLEGVPAGVRQLLIGPTLAGEAAVVVVTVPEGGKANADLVVLKQTGALIGVANALDATEQAGTQVSLQGTPFSVLAGVGGNFQLVGVPAYCADVRFDRPGYQPRVVTACIEPGGITDMGTTLVYPDGVCVPDCEGKTCGSDGCSESCGECPASQACVDGNCEVGGECGNDNCESSEGETCMTCPGDCICSPEQACTPNGCCTADCSQADCGDDGCGGSCGECSGTLVCADVGLEHGGLCVLDTESCGDGTCNPAALESCKTCANDCPCNDGQTCLLTGSCCTPSCGGQQCGDDGCGGQCGDCGPFTCVAGQCVIECAEVAEPEPIDLGSLPTLATEAETKSASGFVDHFLTSPTGPARVGVRENWGGTIVYFGSGPSVTNVLDDTNGTRGITAALVDPDRAWQGCAYNASCVSQPTAACPKTHPFVGWQPALGINECGVLPALDSVVAEAGVIRTELTLLQRNPDWAASGCTNAACVTPGQDAPLSDVRYTQTVRFVAPTVLEVQTTLKNLSSTDHAAGKHAVPLVFGSSAAGITLVVDSDGAAITIDEPTPDGGATVEFTSPAGWAAIQSASKSQGVAIVPEHDGTSFRAAVDPAGGVSLHAALPFALAPGAQVQTRTYLMLGSFLGVAAGVGALAESLGPHGQLEQPGPEQTVSKTIAISGWALDNGAIESVEVLLDGAPVEVSRVDVGIARPDVCDKAPGYDGCATSGFQGAASLAGVTPCAHLVEVRATDDAGHTRVIGRARVNVVAGPYCPTDESCEDGDSCTLDTCDSLLGCVGGPKPVAQLAEEVCNSLDDDCDGEVDEGAAGGCLPFYEDADGDTYGVGEPACLCKPVAPMVAPYGGDCNDEDKTIFPLAPEACNGKDDDCDELVDEDVTLGCTNYFKDPDEDSYGVGDPLCACSPPGPPWTALQGGDCDEEDIEVHPNASETCNGKDDNCSGSPDDGGVCPTGIQPIYRLEWAAGGDQDTALSKSPTGIPDYVAKGETFELFGSPGPDRVPFFQSYCESCTDHMAYIDPADISSAFEQQTLLGYCSTAKTGEAPTALMRLFNPQVTDHLVTASGAEASLLTDLGFIDQGVLCYGP